jgi:translation initiation factor IF-2
VTGYGCPQPPDATSDVYGWYSQGDTGFFTVSSGSTTQSGCNGSFVAMPMSGSDATDNTENLAIWTFRFPAGSEACRVDVYIPDETSIVDVGGDPSLYTVYDNGSVVGSFYVDQVGQLGKWVTGGTFPISSGVMTLQVHSRGQDWVGNTVTNAHIAVAAASATCQPA